MHAVVVSDTHIRAGWRRTLPQGVIDAAGTADVILHAGDLVVPEVLDELAAHAPVHAVLGNNDHGLEGRLPERLELELAGVHIGMIHDSGPAKGRAARLHRWFPGCDLVVFGHSHIPWNAPGIDGQWLLNPGSPTERRRQPRATFATVGLDRGRVLRPRIAPIDR